MMEINANGSGHVIFTGSPRSPTVPVLWLAGAVIEILRFSKSFLFFFALCTVI
jgi:hypothetical protein